MLGTNVENSKIALDAIGHMLRSCNNEDILNKVADYVKAVFNGKEGKITQNQQKMYLYQIYEYLSHAKGAGPTVVQNVVNGLTALAEKESSDVVLTVLYRAMKANLKNRGTNTEILKNLMETLVKQAKTNAAGLFGM